MRRGIFIFVLSASSAFAVTEPVPGAPNSGCEQGLVRDPFYLLTEKALESGLLQVEDLKRMATAETAFNPLANRLKQNPALLRGLEQQLRGMTPERWARLRTGLAARAERSTGENSARAESTTADCSC